MDMKLRVRCEDMCAIESLLKSHEHAATTLESESLRRVRGRGRTRNSRSQQPFRAYLMRR